MNFGCCWQSTGFFSVQVNKHCVCFSCKSHIKYVVNNLSCCVLNATETEEQSIKTICSCIDTNALMFLTIQYYTRTVKMKLPCWPGLLQTFSVKCYIMFLTPIHILKIKDCLIYGLYQNCTVYYRNHWKFWAPLFQVGTTPTIKHRVGKELFFGGRKVK